MKKPLKPKAATCNTHPLMEHRLQTADMGYSQAPVRHKRGYTGWSKIADDKESIRTLKDWRDTFLSGTGIRLNKDLVVIDIDCTDWDLAQLILDDLYALDPEAYAAAIHRDSEGASIAIFMRCAEPFRYRATHKYTRHPEKLVELAAAEALPETTEEEYKHKSALIDAIMKEIDAQFVEIHGPESRGRQFQVEGKHSDRQDGAERFYRCGEKTPWNTPRASLPLMPMAPGPMADRFDQIFLGAGLTRIPKTASSSGAPVYDLTPDMMFYPKNGPSGTLEELTADLARGGNEGIPGRAVWIRHSSSQTSAKLFLTDPGGQIAIKDWSDNGTTHFMADAKPAEWQDVSPTLSPLLEGLSAPPPKAEPQPLLRPLPPPEGTFQSAVDWMVVSFCHAKGDLVIPLDAVTPEAGVPVTEFNHRYQKYSVPKVGSPTGALAYASKVWLGHKDMIDVDGFDVRPDMEFPIFWEDGRRYKNLYRKVAHAGEGEIDTFLAFMAHLLPGEMERRLHLQSIAHKRRFPWLPGLATVMVAEGEPGFEQSGTGRGSYFKILERLFGWRYAKRVDWDIVTGKSNQAVYTEWQADLVLAFVEEAKDQGSAGYSGRRGVYEYLKGIVDNAPRRATVKSKYGRHREAMLNCTFIFATNHADAIQIPESDRRFLIVSNGEKLGEDLARRIHAWMDVAGNLAALERWLEQMDLSGYDSYAPPLMTDARERMIELATSEMDELVHNAIMAMAWPAFTKSQVWLAVRNLGGENAAQFGIVFKRMTIGLSHPGVTPKKQRQLRPRKHTNPERVFTRNKAGVKACDAMDAEQLAAAVRLNELHVADSKSEAERQAEELAEELQKLAV